MRISGSGRGASTYIQSNFRLRLYPHAGSLTPIILTAFEPSFVWVSLPTSADGDIWLPDNTGAHGVLMLAENGDSTYNLNVSDHLGNNVVTLAPGECAWLQVDTIFGPASGWRIVARNASGGGGGGNVNTSGLTTSLIPVATGTTDLGDGMLRQGSLPFPFSSDFIRPDSTTRPLDLGLSPLANRFGTAKLSGAVYHGYTDVAANYVTGENDSHVRVDCTSGPITVTLGAIGSGNEAEGHEIVVTNVLGAPGNDVTVTCDPADSIAPPFADVVLANQESATFRASYSPALGHFVWQLLGVQTFYPANAGDVLVVSPDGSRAIPGTLSGYVETLGALTPDLPLIAGTPNGAFTDPSYVVLNKAVLDLTDAQVKALPTAPQVIVGSWGPGTIIVPHKFLVFTKNAAASYTNFNAAAIMGLSYDPAGPSGIPLYSIRNNLGTTWLANLLSNTGLIAQLDGSTPDGTNQDYRILQVNSENKDLVVMLNNAGSGNLTGGNAANIVRVIVWYTVEDLT